MVRRGSFCDAASGRASIYACKAFNTEESAGSIACPDEEPCATAARNLFPCVATLDRGRNMPDTVRPIPPAIRGQKYISLTTFRKNGVAVATPVWFGEDTGKLYVMTRSVMGKTKRIRNNPQVRVAPCTIRGKITGQEFAASARILPLEERSHARQTINRKYLLARLTSVFSRADVFLELTFP